ncbi:MAG: M20/M25/M40 family metallo-hydrolase [Actinobacteria bacterium]|nr:M20/M25/M40 family metallo-hydrolase [Actinomycetota bacterium]
MGGVAMPPLDVASLRHDVEALAALGPHFAGSEGEARAREYLAAELRAAGLEVATEEFAHLAYEPRDAACSILDEDAACACAGLQATASGLVTAEAVYVGDGTEVTEAVEGRIAVFRNGVPTTVAPALAAAGAAGLIALSPAPDGLITHLVASFQPLAGPSPEERVLPIPGVIVEAAAGERLLARLSRGPAKVRLEHRASYAERTSANLVVEIPGSEPDAPKIVVGAHYDSQRESPGAADNATGLAALLAMARAWAGSRPRRTIALVAFGVEETGSWGAADYVTRHASEGIEAMVNLDALGPPLDATRTIVAHPDLAALAADSARSTGWHVEQELDARDFPFADHAPFVAADIPAVWIWRYPPPHPYYHSAGDLPRWVNFTHLAEDAAASVATAWRLANP